MKKYSFAQFDPRSVGAEANEAVFAGAPLGVFGIEVTISALASRCLANLDHHGTGDTAETPSACEQAVSCELPPEGAVLATVRPDADSVAAMAVLELRANDDSVGFARFLERNEVIKGLGRFDRLGPSAGKPAAVVSAIARKSFDFKIPLADRVAWVAKAICEPKTLESEITALVAAHDSELAAARAASEVELHADGRIVSVVSTHRFGTTLGYESAPVVVAMNPAMPVDPKDASKGTYRKFTVCRYDSHVAVDLPAALAEFQALEPGWGGRGDIFGSPQGMSSELTLDQVVEVVSRHLK